MNMTDEIEWKDFELKFINTPHDAYTRRMLQDVVDDYRIRGMENDLRRVLMYEAALANRKQSPTLVYQDSQQPVGNGGRAYSVRSDHPRCGASPAQKKWMLSMLEEIRDPGLSARYTDEAFSLMPWKKDDRGSVQKHIDFLKNRLSLVRRDRNSGERAEIPVEQPAQKSRKNLIVGRIYVMDEKFYRIVESQTGVVYAKVWDGEGWVTEKGAFRRITPNMVASPEDAKRWANLHNNCCFCRKPLSDPRSEKAGYGPDCAEKYGYPWG